MKKLTKQVDEMLAMACCGDSGNTEAGRSSTDHGHWHRIEMDQNGNGRTIYTGPYPHTDENPNSDWRLEMDHVHMIVDGVMEPAEDGHSHEIIA